MTLAEAEARPKKAQFALKTADLLLAEFDALLGDEPARSQTARAAVLAHIRHSLADARKSAEAELLATGEDKPEPPENPMSADRVRWEHIQRVYELCDRNVSETARRLNMHRRTLQRILAKRAPK